MAVTDIQFPYNPNGDREDCEILDESAYLTLTNGVDYQFIIPQFAPFFDNQKLTITSVKENRFLQFNIDYILTHKFKTASDHLNKDIYGSITFLDKNISGEIKLSYSTLGGDFTNKDNLVLEQLAGNLTGHRSVKWEDILNKPVTFPPHQHAHVPNQIMDMNDVIAPLEKIAELIKGDTHPDHKHTMDKIEGLVDALKYLADRVPNNKSIIITPIEPFIINNLGSVLILQLPKVLSKTSIKFSIWLNSDIANSVITVMGDIETGKTGNVPWLNLEIRADNDTFTQRVSGSYSDQGYPLFSLEKKEGIWENISLLIPIVEYDKNIKDNITGDFNCTDGTTLVGKIVDIDEFAYQSDLDALKELLNNVIDVEIANLKEALDNLIEGEITDITNLLNEHVNDKNNPHAVTKDQVGLSNVLNYTSTSDPNDASENKYSLAKGVNTVWSKANQNSSSISSLNSTVNSLQSQINGKYSVNGGTISGNVNVSGSLVAMGNISAYSDIKLKENINSLENCLEKLSSINGYSYNFKNSYKRSIGLIAQEVEKVFPELIQGESIKSVMYGNVTAVLVEAIKELSDKVDALSDVVLANKSD